MAMSGLPIMTTYKHECRQCKKITEQIERIITDNLPPYVKTLQCTKCGVMGVCLVEEPKNGDVSV
jgi:CRISPR/Cas system-associated exonuclease Cas4 (RecB family)